MSSYKSKDITITYRDVIFLIFWKQLTATNKPKQIIERFKPITKGYKDTARGWPPRELTITKSENSHLIISALINLNRTLATGINYNLYGYSDSNNLIHIANLVIKYLPDLDVYKLLQEEFLE